MEDREGLAPETLPAEEPVPQFVIDRRPAESSLQQVCPNLPNEGVGLHPVVGAGGDRPAAASEEWGSGVLSGWFGLSRGRLDHGDNLQPKGLGKLIVAVVVSRYRHDRPGAIGGQHIVGHPNWDQFAGQRVDAG